MTLRIKKNDVVTVIAGKNKGKQGRILRFTKDQNRVFVEGINLVKRFVRPSRNNPQGGQTEREASIHSSNLMLMCPKAKKPTRFKVNILGDGTKVRVSVKSNADIN